MVEGNKICDGRYMVEGKHREDNKVRGRKDDVGMDYFSDRGELGKVGKRRERSSTRQRSEIV